METKRVRVQDLAGSALDWAVALCEGHKPTVSPEITTGDVLLRMAYPAIATENPSSTWPRVPGYCRSREIGGEVTDKARIGAQYMPFTQDWQASLSPGSKDRFEMYGPTPLVASLRTRVAIGMGRTLDVPVELLVSIRLVSRDHGFADYDVAGMGTARRLCVPIGSKPGDICNVYDAGGAKHGARWAGSPERTLSALSGETVIVERSRMHTPEIFT